MRIPTAISIDPRNPGLQDEIRALTPRTSGIYALVRTGDRQHISWSPNLSRRLSRLLVGPPNRPGGLLGRLADRVDCVECWLTGSRLETSILMYSLMKSYFPHDYLGRLKLRMPWLVGLSHPDPFPRLVLANRIARKSNALFGPFPSRELAQRYEEELMALFQVRRCTEILEPRPEHPGCIYGEMNQCLRPCQAAVSPEEYKSEARRVADFLATNGRTAMAALSAARDRAANETDFEQAALIHKRIERMRAAAGTRDDVISEVHEFSGVALTRGVRPRQFRIWPMVQGYWQEALTLDFAGEGSSAKSLDHELREQLGLRLADFHAGGGRMEHLAIFSRWYYSSWRDGDWFPFRALADLNYRRLVRAISMRVKAQASAPC